MQIYLGEYIHRSLWRQYRRKIKERINSSQLILCSVVVKNQLAEWAASIWTLSFIRLLSFWALSIVEIESLYSDVTLSTGTERLAESADSRQCSLH